ncbi:hypothetical protein KST01_03745 [Fusobacterium animalis]|uniref:hypothetical protein n=1 Tax=Fusobacterium TaxID=848 RepID=UPI0030B7548F
MKKYFILFMCCLFLMSCGKDYKTYSLEEKKEMIKEAVIENRNGNKEKVKKLDEIVKKLEEAAKNGDKEAEKELKEWYAARYLI